MQIRPTVTQIDFRENTQRNIKPATIPQKQEPKGLSNMEKAGIGLFSAISLGVIATLGIIEFKKPPRKSFEQILNKNGLEFKNNFLVKRSSGDKFTGELKRSTGKLNNIGSEKIETQKFANGVITEKIYTDWRGNEIEGYFYKDGEIKLHVSSIIGKESKCYSYSDYKNGQPVNIGDGFVRGNKSVFEIARNSVQKNK